MILVAMFRDAWGLLKYDLYRQFVLEGHPERKVSSLQVVLRSLHPRLLPLLLCRFSRALFLANFPVLPFILSYLNLLVFGLQITPRCEIGRGLFLPHPNGIVIGSWRIGTNVTLFQQVTLGAKTIDLVFTPTLLPDIGDNVTIGAGAKVLGGIRIGDNVVIGANSVVLDSVENGSTVVGIPARQVCSARTN